MPPNIPSPCTRDDCVYLQPGKRLLHLDLLRLMAIYLVIFNHTGEYGYLLFSHSRGSALYALYMLTSVFCKAAVPIFFMISGALLLPKQESLGELLTKRVLRMAAVLLLISVPYYLWLQKSKGFSVLRFLTFIYGDSASTSLWYLYSYIALLLMMPFLRSMVKSMREQDYLYLTVGYVLFFGVLPCLEYCLWKGEVTAHESFSPALFLAPNIYYALMGYYLEHVADSRKKEKRIVWGVALSIAALAVTCLLTHYQLVAAGVKETNQLERFFECFICIPAMTSFELVKYAEEKIRSTKLQKLLSFVGGTVFGIYLIEKVIRSLTRPLVTVVAAVTGPFAASLIWALAVFCISFVIIAVLKSMPIIKKVVNRFL